MNSIKKATITAGTVIGGVIGGSIQLTGKMTGVKFLDSLGESIIDSTIHTGTIAGEIISGGAELAVGKIKKDEEIKNQGKKNLKSGGSKIVNNFTDNVKVVADSGAEIAKGTATLDRKRVARATKRLVKVAAIGTITVGAIKLAEDEYAKTPNSEITVEKDTLAKAKKRAEKKAKRVKKKALAKAKRKAKRIKKKALEKAK